jgi:hypothetical protein
MDCVFDRAEGLGKLKMLSRAYDPVPPNDHLSFIGGGQLYEPQS